jgi:hypothetical protein
MFVKLNSSGAVRELPDVFAKQLIERAVAVEVAPDQAAAVALAPIERAITGGGEKR